MPPGELADRRAGGTTARGAIVAGFSGTVSDADDMAGVSFATVDVFDSGGVFVTSAIAEIDGSYVAELDSGTYFARTSTLGDPHLDELYDDIPCGGGACDPTTGTPIVVPADTVVSGIDFALDIVGIEGTVRDAGGTTLPFASVFVFDASGELQGSFLTDLFGAYIAGVPPGSYFASALASGEPYVGELYSEMVCPAAVACDVTAGTTITVPSGGVVSGIDFSLELSGFTGTVTDEGTAAPLTLAEVDVFDSTGDYVASFFTTFDGTYDAGLPSGSYFARASNSGEAHVGELYQDLPCPGDLLDGTPLPVSPCDATTGTAVVVASVTTGIDFALERSGFTGTLTEDPSGDPIGLQDIVVYDTAGAFVARFLTALDGTYAAGLPPATYHAVTDTFLPFVDELWDDLGCAAGSCDPTAGDPIAVAADTVVPGIDFALLAASGDIDASGTVDALTDGLLILRFLFGFNGEPLTEGAVSPDCDTCLPEPIEELLELLDPLFDIDGDGETEALTDGLLILRYIFGFRGAALIDGAVDEVSCTRCTAEEIEAYLALILE